MMLQKLNGPLYNGLVGHKTQMVAPIHDYTSQ